MTRVIATTAASGASNGPGNAMPRRNATRVAAFIVGFFFLVLLRPPALPAGKKDDAPKLPTPAQLKIARAIGMGHSYQKHVLDEKQFPEVKGREEFIELIAKVIANPTHHKELENDREAFYDAKSNIIVIHNPHARDKGTAFRPSAGLRYFKNLR
jgi:hypothetical protein